MTHADECPFLFWLEDEARALKDLAWRVRAGLLDDPLQIAIALERLAQGADYDSAEVRELLVSTASRSQQS